MGVDDIPGWFGWQQHTDRVVADAPPGSTLLEVGVFCGKSLAYLATAARVRRDGLRVVGVDHFRGSVEHAGLQDAPPNALISSCYHYLHAAGQTAPGVVALIVTESVLAAEFFPDGSVWSVFLDGDHSEAGVAADIAAWLPKVSPGGYIAGDDYWGFPGVKAAVDAAFGDRVETDPGRCWWASRKGA